MVSFANSRFIRHRSDFAGRPRPEPGTRADELEPGLLIANTRDGKRPKPESLLVRTRSSTRAWARCRASRNCRDPWPGGVSVAMTRSRWPSMCRTGSAGRRYADARGGRRTGWPRRARKAGVLSLSDQGDTVADREHDRIDAVVRDDTFVDLLNGLVGRMVCRVDDAALS